MKIYVKCNDSSNEYASLRTSVEFGPETGYDEFEDLHDILRDNLDLVDESEYYDEETEEVDTWEYEEAVNEAVEQVESDYASLVYGCADSIFVALSPYKGATADSMEYLRVGGYIVTDAKGTRTNFYINAGDILSDVLSILDWVDGNFDRAYKIWKHNLLDRYVKYYKQYLWDEDIIDLI